MYVFRPCCLVLCVLLAVYITTHFHVEAKVDKIRLSDTLADSGDPRLTGDNSDIDNGRKRRNIDDDGRPIDGDTISTVSKVNKLRQKRNIAEGDNVAKVAKKKRRSVADIDNVAKVANEYRRSVAVVDNVAKKSTKKRRNVVDDDNVAKVAKHAGKLRSRRNTVGGRIADITNKLSREKRTVIKCENCYWVNATVYYEFDPNLTLYEKNTIYYYMRIYEHFSMFRFKPKSERDDTDQTYISFQPSGTQTSGWVSDIGDNKQTDPNNQKQTIQCTPQSCLHELSHVLGVMHGHQADTRDTYMQILTDNVEPGRLSNFYKSMPTSVHTSSFGLNLFSPTLYASTVFSKNGLKTTKLLDSEFDYLQNGWTRNFDLYYTVYELQTAYGLTNGACASFASSNTCENGGYVSMVDGVCTCRCIDGLESSSLCTTLEPTDTAGDTLKFPNGGWALLQPTDECPSGFTSDGWVKHASTSGFWISTFYDAAPGYKGNYDIQHSFCVHDASLTSGPTVFPEGGYCIMKGQGEDCPTGFTQGHIQFDDATTESSGTLPDGEFTSDTKMIFCCRDDGVMKKEIAFPTSSPLILFPYGARCECQQIKGMQSRWEYFRFNNDASSSSIFAISGEIPCHKIDYDYNIEVRYCYYTKVDQDGGAIITLNDTNPSHVITSPNYPAHYDNDVRLLWLIKTENSADHIKVVFNDLAVNQHYKGECEDYVEFGHYLPGVPGKHLCGYIDDMDKNTYRSAYDMVKLRLHTDNSGTNKGFSVTVSLSKDEDLCYTDGGRKGAYSGTKSITKNFKTCINWNEAKDCKHHPFNGGDYEDSLESNYCRNPNDAISPWCYIDKVTCEKDFCDVCSIEECRDALDNCDVISGQRNQHCVENPVACAKSCDHCDEESCFTTGNTYTGSANVTKTGTSCIEWYKIEIGFRDYIKNENFPDDSVYAARNYCRDPYGGTDPWCFTDISGNWGYCIVDKCAESSTTCLDTSTTCVADKEIAATNNNYCSIADDATKCALSCTGSCPVDDSVTSCVAPNTISGSSYAPIKYAYNLGDTVTYTCTQHTSETKTRTCSSDGTWKPELSMVCGACPGDYVSDDKICRKYVDQFMTGAQANAYCQAEGAIVISGDAINSPSIQATIDAQGYNPSSLKLWIQNPTNCYDNGQGRAYSESTAVTSSGAACDQWIRYTGIYKSYVEDANFPSDGSVVDASNYCRAPDADATPPWCFKDGDGNWGWCDVPDCADVLDPASTNCYVNGQGRAYNGSTAVTSAGDTCEPWTSYTGRWKNYVIDANFPSDGSVVDASNYCRAPDADATPPWCFLNVTNNNFYGSWGWCGVPVCAGSGECSLIKKDGSISTESCTDDDVKYPTVCEFAVSARTKCVDQDPSCGSMLESSPYMCVEYTNFAWDRCARTCGRCTDSDPNSDNTG